MQTTRIRVDARGLSCPVPVIMTRHALETGSAEVIVEVLCDDVISACDVEVWVTSHGYVVMMRDNEAGSIRLTIAHLAR